MSSCQIAPPIKRQSLFLSPDTIVPNPANPLSLNRDFSLVTGEAGIALGWALRWEEGSVPISCPDSLCSYRICGGTFGKNRSLEQARVLRIFTRSSIIRNKKFQIKNKIIKSKKQ